MDAPKSRGTWGREAYKTDEELNAACRALFGCGGGAKRSGGAIDMCGYGHTDGAP